ncbi:unnamed protein product [Ranitomeya imitator]|uniref:Uncharacterized protein n=1 Tax=Ranitomeya imitator TaxID=111125 RepID=A0ABN9KZA9_9NEOB|nr:unnamed protein product [Ranitomeya imitator]
MYIFETLQKIPAKLHSEPGYKAVRSTMGLIDQKAKKSVQDVMFGTLDRKSKPDGSYRTIINLKGLNKFLKIPKFKMSRTHDSTLIFPPITKFITFWLVSCLEKRLIELEDVAKKLKEANEELTGQNVFLKRSITCLQKDADLKERKLQEMNWKVLEVNQAREALEWRKHDLSREVASLKKLLAGNNKLRSTNRELVMQVQFLQDTLDKAIASAPAVPKEANRQGRRKELGTKVKQNEARKISRRRHQAFLNQYIKVMSSVFENFSKDGWEDVSEDSDVESESSESMGEIIVKTALQPTSTSAEESSAVEERNVAWRTKVRNGNIHVCMFLTVMFS